MSVASLQQRFAGFDMGSMGGLALWLDAADPNAFTFSSGSNIATWRDKSGNGRDATARNGSPVFQPTGANGLPTVLFSNAPSMTGSLTSWIPAGLGQTDLTGFVVCTPFATTAGQRLISAPVAGNLDTASTAYFYVFQPGGSFGFGRQASTVTGSGFSLSNPQLVSFYSDASAIFAHTPLNTNSNRVAFPNSNYGTSLSYSIGAQFCNAATNIFNGRISEVLLFRGTALETSNRLHIETYLMEKWGLRSTGVFSPFRAGRPFLRPFSPLDMSGCQLWLDAADRTSITMNGIGQITEWRDKSGFFRHFTPVGIYSNATVATGFQAGLDVVEFTGFNVYRAANTAPAASAFYPLDVYVVVALKSLSLSADVFGYAINSTDFTCLSYGYPTASRWQITSSNNTRTTGTALGANETSTGFLLMNMQICNNSYNVRRNGSLSNTPQTYANGTTNAPKFQIGFRASNATTIPTTPFNAYVAEVIAFPTFRTTIERQRVENYLSRKWGLESSVLTGTHPFIRYKSLMAPFHPLLIPGCVLWLDAGDTCSFTFSSGSNITQWRDKSGRQNHMNTVSATPPFVDNFEGSNYLGVYFPSTDVAMQSVSNNLSTAANGRLVACVIQAPFGDSVVRVGTGSNAAGFNNAFIIENNPNINTLYAPFTGLCNNTISLASYGRLLVTASKPPTTTTALYGNYNGNPLTVKASTVISTVQTPWYMGGTGLVPCQNALVYEFLHYNAFGPTSASVSNELVQMLEGYLATKWGLRDQLATNHPYYFPRVSGPGI